MAVLLKKAASSGAAHSPHERKEAALARDARRRPQLATASRLKALRYALASPCLTLDEEQV